MPSGEDVPDEFRRARWMNNAAFVLACVGSSIGLGNFWKFPYLTFKHGGGYFIGAYAVALFTCGIPMLILELTLGQKMQRGSAGAMRGITPRLAGAGWAATLSSFFVVMVYNVLIGLSIVYMVQGGKQPWSETNYERKDGCNTAALKSTSSAELFFYQDTTKLFNEKNCEQFEYGQGTVYAWGLYAATAVTWVLCFLSVLAGPKSIQYITMITVPLKFICLVALIVYFTGLNKNDNGKGMGYYLGGEDFPVGNLDDGTVVYYDPTLARPEIIQDAYLMVLYSVGIGVGIFFSYGSYQHIKQPVIANSIIICLLDFIFSILAGLVGWGAIGYLQIKGSTAALQTSSVGLGFIAFPEATSLEEDKNGKGWFTFLMFTLFIASIDSAFSYVESVVTNLIDDSNKFFKEDNHMSRPVAALLVCLMGILLSITFTSNFGWVFFDLCDHYISSYVILAAALLECISVGWVFERESTARMSEDHRKSLRWLAIVYWFPVVIISFYSHFGFPDNFEIGIIIIFCTSCLSLLVSYCVAKGDHFKDSESWYHEIMLCGVDKISMSITSLSVSHLDFSHEGERKPWMAFFEGYFGIMIKFLNPAALIFMLFQNLAADLKSPYAEQPSTMQMYGTIFLFLIVLLFGAFMVMCDYPEKFYHNVNQEFDADNQFAAGIRGIKRAGTQKFNAENEVEISSLQHAGNNTVTPLVTAQIQNDGQKVEEY